MHDLDVSDEVCVPFKHASTNVALMVSSFGVDFFVSVEIAYVGESKPANVTFKWPIVQMNTDVGLHCGYEVEGFVAELQ